jgi:hypothetical protein
VLVGADVAVMVATSNDGAAAASAIGDACTMRGIMTAGLVLTTDGTDSRDGNGQHANGRDASAAVTALRPHARVIMVTQDEHDVSEVLTALRA